MRGIADWLSPALLTFLNVLALFRVASGDIRLSFSPCISYHPVAELTPLKVTTRHVPVKSSK